MNFIKIKASDNRDKASSGADIEEAFNGNFDVVKSKLEDLENKGNSSHNHTIANVTNLQSNLDGKAASSHTHTIANITNLQSNLDSKAATSHTHTMSQITDFSGGSGGSSNIIQDSGTWTPSGSSLNSNGGNWRRTGNIVQFTARLSGSGNNTSATINVSGFPTSFTPRNDTAVSVYLSVTSAVFSGFIDTSRIIRLQRNQGSSIGNGTVINISGSFEI
jgi:hypothetical protein